MSKGFQCFEENGHVFYRRFGKLYRIELAKAVDEETKELLLRDDDDVPKAYRRK